MDKETINKTNVVVADCVKAVEFAIFKSSVLFGRNVQRDKCYQKKRKK